MKMTEEQRAARIAKCLEGVDAPIPSIYDISPKDESPKNVAVIQRLKGETRNDSIARAALSPLYTGAITSKRFSKSMVQNVDVDLNAAVVAVEAVVARVHENNMSDMEGILASQAVALNCVFAEMMGFASVVMRKDTAKTEAYMRMAMRAQSNCRAAIETLSEIKNPRTTTFVRQQNNANQQQVNNGEVTAHDIVRAPAEKYVNVPNKLLESDDGERLDTGKKSEAGRADPQLAALDKVDRTKERSGKSGRQRECAKERVQVG